MKRTITLSVLMIVIPFLARAQFPSELQNIFQEILMEQIFESGAKGMSVSVVSEDNIWASAAGLHATDSILTTNSVIGMGSITKTITSATILDMMEDGLLNLNDPISLYLDTMVNIPPQVTIRQLLSHTSGIHNYSGPDINAYFFSDLYELVTEETILENFVGPPIFEPGTQYSYSNTNYQLLALIIEAISGQAYYLEARKRFDFDSNYPSFTLPPYEIGLTELAHIFADTSTVAGSYPAIDVVELGYVLNSVFSGTGAAGAYASTPSDLAQWAYDLYTGKLLEEASMDSMFTIPSVSTDYGLGVLLLDLPPCGLFVGHNGEAFYTASAYYIPQSDIAVAVQCNDASNIELTDELAFQLACAYYAYTTSTNTENLVSNESIEIFPNPFSEGFSLKYEASNTDKIHVELYNEMGVKLNDWNLRETTIGTQEIQLDTDVPTGIYFLKIQMGDRIISKRVVKI